MCPVALLCHHPAEAVHFSTCTRVWSEKYNERATAGRSLKPGAMRILMPQYVIGRGLCLWNWDENDECLLIAVGSRVRYQDRMVSVSDPCRWMAEHGRTQDCLRSNLVAVQGLQGPRNVHLPKALSCDIALLTPTMATLKCTRSAPSFCSSTMSHLRLGMMTQTGCTTPMTTPHAVSVNRSPSSLAL